MTKRELWLKPFAENDTALASAIHLCERFVTPESLETGEAFLREKKKALYEQVDPKVVSEIFPNYKEEGVR